MDDYAAFEDFFVALVGFWPLFLITALLFLRKVPKDTALVIDRNGHYLKTKRSGFYIFNPSTDEVTSKISTYPSTKYYNNVFETHDSRFYRIGFMVIYKAEDLEQVLSSLSDSRRSIDDVINCAMETLVASCVAKEMTNYPELNERYFSQLEYMLEPFYIDVTKTSIQSIQTLTEDYGRENKFERHVSGSDSSNDPIH